MVIVNNMTKNMSKKLVENLTGLTEGQTGYYIVVTEASGAYNHYGPFSTDDQAQEIATELGGQVYPLLEPSRSGTQF